MQCNSAPFCAGDDVCLNVCGVTALAIPALRATWPMIGPVLCWPSCRPSAVRKRGPSQRSPVARSIAPRPRQPAPGRRRGGVPNADRLPL